MPDTPVDLGVQFDNTYAKDLDGFYINTLGDKAPKPVLLKLNHALLAELGIDFSQTNSDNLAAAFSGGTPVKGANPLAQVYAGHQFGGFSPQLGDGRAILLGEIRNLQKQRVDIQLKGAGKTVFSRGGDGKAALGTMLREYIVAEAMHALCIPTTRSLAVVGTGEQVMRENLLPGAVLTRVASSHIRVGTFQYFSARGEIEKVKQLADYTIARHFPDLKQSSMPYLELIRQVSDRQAELIAKWMLVGFVHGVMNTDNMTVAGETIDYGPCAFLDTYDPATVFSSIDREGRYAYGNQPKMALWNLSRFAETLLPLIDENIDQAIEVSVNILDTFDVEYSKHWLDGMRLKLGFMTSKEEDTLIIAQLLQLMQEQRVDFTQFFRQLSEALDGGITKVDYLFNQTDSFTAWYSRWQQRISTENISHNMSAIKNSMDQHNPIYIPRNHKVEEALQEAENNMNFEPFEKLIAVLTQPFTKIEGANEYALPAPSSFGAYKTFCGT